MTRVEPAATNRGVAEKRPQRNLRAYFRSGFSTAFYARNRIDPNNRFARVFRVLFQFYFPRIGKCNFHLQCKSIRTAIWRRKTKFRTRANFFFYFRWNLFCTKRAFSLLRYFTPIFSRGIYRIIGGVSPRKEKNIASTKRARDFSVEIVNYLPCTREKRSSCVCLCVCVCMRAR